MTERTDAIIIGAGHNGLVCAAYLAQAGLNVVCLESAGSAGGMSAPRTIGEDYHFPGLAHTTYPVSQSMRKDLKLDQFGYAPGHAIDTIALDTSGNRLTIGAGAASGEGLSDQDAVAYPKFRDQYLAFAKAGLETPLKYSFFLSLPSFQSQGSYIPCGESTKGILLFAAVFAAAYCACIHTPWI